MSRKKGEQEKRKKEQVSFFSLFFSAPVMKSVGQLLLIKGPRWPEENAEAEAAGLLNRLKLESVAEWPTPGRDGLSVLLKIVKAK